MPVTTSYPGVYIEELPSLSHSVTAAPTSVTVFVGYTHPLIVPSQGYNTAIELHSFADYQSNFGGFFDFSTWLPDYVGNAVYQFFLNGGSDAWVVGLQATEYVDDTGAPVQVGGQDVMFGAATLVLDMAPATVTLTAQQPGGVDPTNNTFAAVGTPTQVTLSNLQPATGTATQADITITCGSLPPEIYRAVQAGQIASVLAQSNLVTVTVTGGTPAGYPAGKLPNNNGYLAYTQAQLPPDNSTLISTAAYGPVFEQGASLDVDVLVFNLMVLPGISPVNIDQDAVLSQALAYCEQKRAFFIMDAPPNATTSAVGPQPTGQPPPITMDDFWNNPTEQTAEPSPPVSQNGAIYFPYLQTVNQVTQAAMISPPSGFVAGIFAQEDVNYSVGKAPAGLETTILGTSGVVPWGRMTDLQQGTLNNDGVNCLRQFPGIGSPVVFGARTLVSQNPAFQQWMYVPVRRTALFLEQSLYGSLGWAVFQPNAQPLWDALTQEVEAFMLSLFRQGNYFAGDTPTQAFLVQCDSTTTTPQDVANGVVNILVGFAPLIPAEFVVIQITQLAGQAQT
jgi:uncharacterized protein